MNVAGFKGGAKRIRDSLSEYDERIIPRGTTTLTVPRYVIKGK